MKLTVKYRCRRLAKLLVFTILACGLSGPNVLAQQNSASVRGQVTSADGMPVAGAEVRIKHLPSGAVTRSETGSSGEFSKSGLLVGGPYEIRVVADDYGTEVQDDIFLQAGSQNPQAIALERIDSIIDRLVVHGQRLSDQRSITRKRNSEAILDAISADEVGKLPVFNAAEAADFLPGVSLERDQGEGRFITIRGAGSRLNNVTINGVNIGSPSEKGDGRRVPLDIIGGEQIRSIEVIKAVTPDMDAQGIGGTANVETQSPFDFEGSTFFTSAAGGYSEFDDRFSFRGSATGTYRFGADDSWGVLGGISYSERDFQSRAVTPDDDWEALGVRQPDGTISVADARITDRWRSLVTDIERERLAGNFAVETRPNENSRYYFRALWSEFNETESRRRSRQTISDEEDGVNLVDSFSNGVATFSGLRRETELRLERKDKRIFTMSAGGENVRGPLTLEYELAYTENILDEPNQNWRFRNSDTSGTFDTRPFLITLTPDQDALNPDDFAFNRLKEQKDFLDDETISGALDATWEADFISEGSYLKAGVDIRDRESDQDINAVRNTSGDRCTLGQFGLSAGPRTVNVDGQSFQIGPIIDTEALQEFLDADNGCIVVDEDKTDIENLIDDFIVEERVFAGYAMGSFEIGDRLTILGGVRVEHTENEGSGFEIAEETVETAPISNEGDYTNALPNLHLRYRLGENTQARFAWTNTVGRPALNDLAPRRSVEFTEDPDDPEFFNGSFSDGNPNLDPFTSSNLDVSFEHYLEDNLGIVSVALFYKDIEDFIVEETVDLAGGSSGVDEFTFSGLTFTELRVTRPVNAQDGELLGTELGYTQQWDFLPSFFRNFGTSVNYTYVDGELNLDGRTVGFPKQSEHIFSVRGFYESEKVEVNITFNRTSEFLDEVGGGPAGDIFINDSERLDLNARYRIGNGVSAFVEWRNINNEPEREFQATPRQVTGFSEQGETVFLGFDFRI